MVHFIFIAPMHSYVTNVLVYNLHMTIFSRVYSYVLVCYLYVTRMYSCVTRMLLVCIRMLLVCTRVYSYVTRMYSYVTCMLLACSFSHNHFILPILQILFINCQFITSAMNESESIYLYYYLRNICNLTG